MPRFAIDNNAYGLAAVGVLECVALLVFAVAPAARGSGAAPAQVTAGMPATAMARPASYLPGRGGFSENEQLTAAPAGLSICADVNTGFICAP